MKVERTAFHVRMGQCLFSYPLYGTTALSDEDVYVPVTWCCHIYGDCHSAPAADP